MDPDRKKVAAIILAAAGFVLFAFSTAAMLKRLEPFYTCYYSFAWWSYIVIVQALLHRKRGDFLLFDNPGKFLVLLPLSVTVWLIFEAFNFRLSNWRYVSIPPDMFERWTGYAIAYATVLPGIFSTLELLDSAGVLKNSRRPPLADARGLYRPFILAGAFCVVLPLVWPQFFFPLVWGAFIFLLEPLNHRLGAPSLLRGWERGSLRTFYLLLLAGLLCGLLWEMWNFRAGAKWIYTVPHVGFLKIFEMPALGFLGFPPFAVECYAMTASFFALAGKIREKYSRQKALCLYLFGAALVLVFDLLVLAGIDRLTVLSYQAASG
ncbi:MAG: hypothetical protein WAW37_04530 [Syntrophobacteraceae bacterium]